jgi:hypothetical protein
LDLIKNIDKINWRELYYNPNSTHLKNNFIDKFNFYNEVDVIFETYVNTYNTLKKSYTKLIYNI